MRTTLKRLLARVRPQVNDEVGGAAEALPADVALFQRPRLGRVQQLRADILFLKHDSSIFRQSSNPVCGFSMLEEVRLCAV